MINQKLTPEQQHEILYEVFGFNVVNESDNDEQPHYVIYDDDNREFFGNDKNCSFDLSTIAGIIRYAEAKGEEIGYRACQNDFRELLGITARQG
jgi:hypothetical protein